MTRKHKRTLEFGNPLRAAVGQPFYSKKPSDKKIIEELLKGLVSAGTGTCWNPVAEVIDGKTVSTNLIFLQCPGACGEVWKINIRDHDVANFLVNEVNQRRFGV